MVLARPPRNPVLIPFVDSLWVYGEEHHHRLERLLPTGRMQLLVNLAEDELRDYTLDGRPRFATSGAALAGAHSQPIAIDTAAQRSVCGVSFWPGGAYPFFGIGAHEVSEQTVDLRDVWGGHAVLLREKLLETDDAAVRLDRLEQALVDCADRVLSPDRTLYAARLLASPGARVSAVAGRLAMSRRAFIARFRTYVGVTPKRFARVARFQRFLHSIDSGASWVDLALRHGYADQAHAIREFRAFSGTTPTTYRARVDSDRNHALLDPPPR